MKYSDDANSLNIISYSFKLFLIFFSALFILFIESALADTIRVITKENALREACRFYSPVKAILRYRDALEVLSVEGDWYKVKFKGVQGCIHRSAVEARSFSNSQGIGVQRPGATEQEVALAGKGFNPQVEKAFRAKYPQMNFAIVDAIERYKVDDSRVFEFIRLGGLTQP